MILYISDVVLCIKCLHVYLGSHKNQYKSSVSVLQHPESEAVHTGDTVTLMCSVLSEYNTVDIRMFWFRSESGKSEILYTQNQNNHCETDSARNCTFSLSKNISQMDTGTYYCAVVTCGKILFGNGTKLNMGKCLIIFFSGIWIFCREHYNISFHNKWLSCSF